MRAGVGGAFVSDPAFDIDYEQVLLPAIVLPTETTFDLGAGFAAGGGVGYDFGFLRTELEYRYAASDVNSVTVNDFDIGVDDDSTYDAHLFFANVYYDFKNSSRFTPFIGGGAGGAVVGDEENDTVFAFQGRAGVAYDFGGGLFGDVEYIYVRSGELEFGPDDLDLFTFGGDRYESSSVMASIRKRF